MRNRFVPVSVRLLKSTDVIAVLLASIDDVIRVAFGAEKAVSDVIPEKA